MRDGKRVPLNWQGTEQEMNQFAQKISDVTGVRWNQAGIPLPAALKTVMEKIAPEEMKELERENAEASNSTQTETMPPTDTLTSTTSGTFSSVPMNELESALTPALPEATPTDDTPAINLQSLSIADLEKRIAGDTMDSDARYVLARKYHEAKQLDRAIALYQETLRTDSMKAEAQNDLGVALVARGKRTEAETAYRRAIALDPFSFNAHLNLALLLRASNRAAEASQELYQARRNAQNALETQVAETASSGTKIEPRLSKM